MERESQEQISNFINDSEFMLPGEKKFFSGEIENGKYDSRYDERLSLLDAAAIQGNQEVLDTLIVEAEVDVDSANKHGTTALHHAANYGQADVVNSLINDHEADFVQKTASTQDTPLDSAIKGAIKGTDTMDVVKEFLENGLSESHSKEDYERKFNKEQVNEASETFELIDDYNALEQSFEKFLSELRPDELSEQIAFDIANTIAKSSNKDFLQDTILEKLNNRYLELYPRQQENIGNLLEKAEEIIQEINPESLELGEVFPVEYEEGKIRNDWEMDPLDERSPDKKQDTPSGERLVDATPDNFAERVGEPTNYRESLEVGLEEIRQGVAPDTGVNLVDRGPLSTIAEETKESSGKNSSDDKSGLSHVEKLEQSRASQSKPQGKSL